MQRLQKVKFWNTIQLSMLWCLLLLFAISLGAAFTNTCLAAEPLPGGTLNISSGSPRSLDPHMESTPQVTLVTNNTYNTLLRYNTNMTGFESDLAESYRQIDNLTYEFKLHKGVRFHNIPPVNGRELTSEDVKYSIERSYGKYATAAQQFTRRHFFEGKIASIEAPDKYTVIFKTEKPFAPFLHYLANPFTCIVAKEAVDQFGDLKKNVIGTGPFILKEYRQDSYMILEKNPNYFKKGLPLLDQIKIFYITDENAALTAFVAKRLDATGIQYTMLPMINKEVPDAKIITVKPQHVFVLRFSPWWEGKKPISPPFDQKKVRQALAMAIDKKRLVELVAKGHAQVQVGPIPNNQLYSLPESDQIEYNPGKAKKLLAEAGYPNGFSVDMYTWNATTMIQPAQVIQEMLKDIGVNVTLKTLEFAQYFNKAYKYDYDLALHVTDYSADPADMLTSYYGQNATYYKWSNKEIWKLIDEQSAEMDVKKRVALIQKIQRMVIEDSPQVFLYSLTSYRAERPYLHAKFYENAYQNYICETYWMDKH